MMHVNLFLHFSHFIFLRLSDTRFFFFVFASPCPFFQTFGNPIFPYFLFSQPVVIPQAPTSDGFSVCDNLFSSFACFFMLRYFFCVLLAVLKNNT